jgi:glycosyltransferase involved in cell wall biosynthesis
VVTSTASDTGEAGLHVAVVWQRFLPYHAARLSHLSRRLAAAGSRLTGVEVASSDNAYPFPVSAPKEGDFVHVCCFPRSSYHNHTSGHIFRAVETVLRKLNPDVIFAPATPFPEGMAAVSHRCRSTARVIMMDDAWKQTDRGGALTGFIKRRIHRNIDGAFIPAPFHMDYFRMMGFPEDRLVCGVDVVDNDYYAHAADAARLREREWRRTLSLPDRYFLFVGRFLQRKGAGDLLDAYDRYRRTADDPWDVVLVGDGPERKVIGSRAARMEGVHLAGPRYGDSLCIHYALAGALVVPSHADPWGLVVNEGMASGLPVIVSRGCGAAKSLVCEGVNGWTFDQGDRAALARLMLRISSLTPEMLRTMGDHSRAIAAEWPLDRFSQAVIDATGIPRRRPGGIMADIFTKLWKGRISLT